MFIKKFEKLISHTYKSKSQTAYLKKEPKNKLEKEQAGIFLGSFSAAIAKTNLLF